MYGDEIETEINVIWTKTMQKLQKSMDGYLLKDRYEN